jgi:low affinity Fe/Cu permease
MLPMANNSRTRRDVFQSFASQASYVVGSKWAFLGAVLIIIGWAILGSYFGYSDTWQLVINTATTIITFLMVFLIQNTQNRDARAIHLKLDELIRCLDLAHNDMINVEKLSDEELATLSKKFDNIRDEFENRKQRNYRRSQKSDSAA